MLEVGQNVYLVSYYCGFLDEVVKAEVTYVDKYFAYVTDGSGVKHMYCRNTLIRVGLEKYDLYTNMEELKKGVERKVLISSIMQEAREEHGRMKTKSTEDLYKAACALGVNDVVVNTMQALECLTLT